MSGVTRSARARVALHAALAISVRACPLGGPLQLIARGCSSAGFSRDIPGMYVNTTEDSAGWIAFLRGLVASGLQGVKLVVSHSREGLKNAIAATLPGASWQRCRTHYMRNLPTRAPKSAQGMAGSLVRGIFSQADDKVDVERKQQRGAAARKMFPGRLLAGSAAAVFGFRGWSGHRLSARQVDYGNCRDGATPETARTATSCFSTSRPSLTSLLFVVSSR